jgi:hypothetical protein
MLVIPTALIHAPAESLGAGILDLYTLQRLSRLESMVSHIEGGSITGLLIRSALETPLLEAGSEPGPWKPGTAKVLDTMTRAWMAEAMTFMADSGIDLSHDVSLPTHCIHDEYLMVVFMRQGTSPQKLILLNQCLIFTGNNDRGCSIGRWEAADVRTLQWTSDGER